MRHNLSDLAVIKSLDLLGVVFVGLIHGLEQSSRADALVYLPRIPVDDRKLQGVLKGTDQLGPELRRDGPAWLIVKGVATGPPHNGPILLNRHIKAAGCCVHCLVYSFPLPL